MPNDMSPVRASISPVLPAPRSPAKPVAVNAHTPVSASSMPLVQAQDRLIPEEVELVKQILTTWATTDDPELSATRHQDVSDFSRRAEDGDLQIDGKNTIYISDDANPPKLPVEFAEVRSPDGALVREARLRIHCPVPRFGQLELLGTQPRGGHERPFNMQQGAASASSSSTVQVPRQSLFVTAPDGQLSPLAVAPLTPESKSPRGSASGLIRSLAKLFNSRGSRSSESAAPQKSGIAALPIDAQVADPETLSPRMLQQQELEARKFETQALADRVLGNAAPLVVVNGLSANLLGKSARIENAINELVNTDRPDFADEDAAQFYSS